VSAFNSIDTIPLPPQLYTGLHQIAAMADLTLAVGIVILFGIGAIAALIMAQNQRKHEERKGTR
jgi:hypothetical protein